MAHDVGGGCCEKERFCYIDLLIDGINCGSWLACDSLASVLMIHRGVCTAGKPAPTGSTAV